MRRHLSLISRYGLYLLLFCGLTGTTLIPQAGQAAPEASFPTTFSSYLGGGAYDESRDVTLDSQGNIYLVGGSNSGVPGSGTAFLTTPGVIQPIHNQAANPDGVDNMDMFVTKLSPDGQVIWSTLLGGPCFDKAYAVEVDIWGYVYVAGRAGCNFPYITPGAFQPNFMGGWTNYYGNQDAVILKLSPDGQRVIWGSYFGTSEANIIRDLDIDSAGAVYVAGGYPANSTASTAISDGLSRGYRSKPLGGDDLIVAKIAPNGQQVLWATLLGGSGTEHGSASLRLASDNSVYFLTTTNSANAAVVNAYDSSYNGDWDSYLGRLSADGKQLIFATYLGGSGNDFAANAHNLWIDLAGNPVIAGTTYSADHPVTPGGFQAVYHGGSGTSETTAGDLFVSILSSDGKRLVASTYLGGKLAENGNEGITVDYFGRIVVSGKSYSADYPLAGGGQGLNSSMDNVLTILSSDLSSLVYSTFTGGAGLRALDSLGFAIVGSGCTDRSNWPTLHPIEAYQGNSDASVLRLEIVGGTVSKRFLPLVQK